MLREVKSFFFRSVYYREKRMAEPRVIKSQKGKCTLYFSGYIYHYHSTSRNNQTRYWRCCQRDVCNSRCVTNNDNDNIVIQKDGTKLHLHAPNHADGVAREIVNRIKDRSLNNPNELPVQILRSELSTIRDEEVLVKLPERNVLRRTVNREQNRTRPQNPTVIQDVEILPPYNQTIVGTRFLIHDSGIHSENRILMFATDENLRHLSQSATIFCDGTFKTSPRHFLQLFTVHGTLRGYTFPFLFCFAEKKNEQTYRYIYQQLKQFSLGIGIAISPGRVMMDFELADMNAASAEFAGSEVKGCLFHFTQSIWRNVVSFGLREAYLNQENNVIRNQVRELMTLPFVPIDDIQEVFRLLLDDLDERLDELSNYMQRIYISGRPAHGRRVATAPRFPPPVWNVYDSVLNGDHRTTNVVEGWHNKFQKLLVVHHSSIWKVLENVKAEQSDTEIQIAQLLAGHQNIRQPVKKQYKTAQRQVENIVRNYLEYKDRGDIKTYLRSISYRLKLNPSEHVINVDLDNV